MFFVMLCDPIIRPPSPAAIPRLLCVLIVLLFTASLKLIDFSPDAAPATFTIAEFLLALFSGEKLFASAYPTFSLASELFEVTGLILLLILPSFDAQIKYN
jgi:hypothetical protein